MLELLPDHQEMAGYIPAEMAAYMTSACMTNCKEDSLLKIETELYGKSKMPPSIVEGDGIVFMCLLKDLIAWVYKFERPF